MPRNRFTPSSTTPLSPAGSLHHALREQREARANLQAAEKRLKLADLAVRIAHNRVDHEREERGAAASRAMDAFIDETLGQLFRAAYCDVVKLALAMHVTVATDEQIAHPRRFVKRWAQLYAAMHPLLVKCSAKKTTKGGTR